MQRNTRSVKHVARLMLLCVFMLCGSSAAVRAASMFGRVIDVSSGDLLTIVNLNRPVRVKLIGVDAPEMDQAFGDAAKKHLSDLIRDQGVVVEYSGIAADNSVAGRVLLKEADIGAQMIRDGAAWFDSNNLSRLSETDREIYQQAEQAARSERRGLWQAENPTAPWEFVKARALRKDTRASLKTVASAPAQKSTGERRDSELNNLTLMTRGTAPMMSANEKDFAWAEGLPSKGGWYRFRPEGEDFSALVPENGKQYDAHVPFDGEAGNVTLYVGRDGWSTYMVQWLEAGTRGETHQAALNEGMTGFALGVTSRFGPYTSSSCRPKNQTYMSISGLPGVEFELASCILTGRVRIVTKLVNGKRRMYVLGALFFNEDQNVTRFLNSLAVDAAPPAKTRKR